MKRLLCFVVCVSVLLPGQVAQAKKSKSKYWVLGAIAAGIGVLVANKFVFNPDSNPAEPHKPGSKEDEADIYYRPPLQNFGSPVAADDSEAKKDDTPPEKSEDDFLLKSAPPPAAAPAPSASASARPVTKGSSTHGESTSNSSTTSAPTAPARPRPVSSTNRLAQQLPTKSLKSNLSGFAVEVYLPRDRCKTGFVRFPDPRTPGEYIKCRVLGKGSGSTRSRRSIKGYKNNGEACYYAPSTIVKGSTPVGDYRIGPNRAGEYFDRHRRITRVDMEPLFSTPRDELMAHTRDYLAEDDPSLKAKDPYRKYLRSNDLESTSSWGCLVLMPACQRLFGQYASGAGRNQKMRVVENDAIVQDFINQ